MAILRSAVRGSSSSAPEGDDPSAKAEAGAPSTKSIHSSPEVVTSTVSARMLEEVRQHYQFPPGYSVVVACDQDRIKVPPPNCLGVYIEHLRAGLRFPLHSFILKILKLYCLVPAQLTPNSIRVICAFLVLCNESQIEPTLSLFTGLFVLKRDSKGFGWWMFSARPERRLVEGLPSAIHGWKEGFFFLSSVSPWECSPQWSYPNLSPNVAKDLSEADSLRYARLLSYRRRPLKELLSEHNLFLARISPFTDLGKKMKLSRDTIRSAAGKRPKAGGASGREEKKKRRVREPTPTPVASPVDEVVPAEASAQPSGGPAAQGGRPAPVAEVHPALSSGSEQDNVALAERYPGIVQPVEEAKSAASSPVLHRAGEGPKSSSAAKGKKPIAVEEAQSRSPSLDEAHPDYRKGSGLVNSAVAEEVIWDTILPADWKITRDKSIGEMRQGFYQSILQVIHNGIGLNEALSEMCLRARKDREAAEEGRKVVTQINRGLSKEVAESGARIDALNRSLELRDGEVADLKESNRLLKLEAGEAGERAEAASKKAEVAVKRAEAAEAMLGEAKKAIQASTKRADQAEKILQESTGRANQAIQAAEDRAAKAVAAYKTSEGYKQELIKASGYSYRTGANDTFKLIQREFPHLNLSAYKPEFEEGEEESSDSGEAEGEAEEGPDDVTQPPPPASPEGIEEGPKGAPVEEAAPKEADQEVVGAVHEEAIPVDAVQAVSAEVQAGARAATSEEILAWTP